MLAKVDANGLEAAEVLIDHVGWRGLENHLELQVLVQEIRIFTVAAVGGTAAGLDVSDAIGLGSEHAQERFRGHGAGAHFQIVRFLNNATAVRPVLLEAKDGLLEGHRDSRILGVWRLRSTCCSINLFSKRRRSGEVSFVHSRADRLEMGVRSISSARSRDSWVTSRSGRNPAKRTDQRAK